MKKAMLAASAVIGFTTSSAVWARDDHLKFPVKDALEFGKSQNKLDAGIPLFFKGQKNPEPKKHFVVYSANRKTNAVGKTDAEACNWVFLSSVIALQERARKEPGANAVINIRSVYRNTFLESPTEFMCGAGNIMAGVALEGEVVQLP